MLDQKVFGEKLRNHRKRLDMTQEEVAEKVGVSPQAISKWENGECLPDCFNLKALSDVYKISTDVLLETQLDGDIDSVAGKIEQLGTEFIWATANCDRCTANLRQELGEDLWKMWKGIYFAEVGERKKREESKREGSLRINGSFGTKIWDDDGVACVIKSELIKKLSLFDQNTIDVMRALCSEEGQKLILSLYCDHVVTKEEIIKKTNIDVGRLNELLLMFTENRIIEYVADNHVPAKGYLMGGHCGIVAYMMLTAMYILNKERYYSVSQFLKTEIL